jgi:phage terminase large subunit GpA-like protein
MIKVSQKQDDQLMVKETKRKAREFKRHNLDVQIYNKKAAVKPKAKKSSVDVLA